MPGGVPGHHRQAERVTPRRPARRSLRLARPLPICALLACASPPRPAETLHAYAEALEGGDADRAWSLLSDDLRKRLSREALARALRDDHEEARHLATEVRAAAERLRVHAVVDAQGESFDLVLEDGSWKLAGNPLDFYGQATPRQALRSFLRAIRHRRWEIVLRFVPERWKGSLTAEALRDDWEGPRKSEIAQLVRKLKPHVLDPIEEQGDRAFLVYGPDARVEFVREGGVWKIADPD